MAESFISGIELTGDGLEFPAGGDVAIGVKFSLTGALRDSFNEKNWTEAYAKYDNTFKLKYGIKMHSAGIKKRTLGKEIETYKKASIFWTRNPKLVNPMKDKRIWVQVASNFRPVIRMTEEEVRQELFEFDEKIIFKAADLGSGKYKVGAEAHASWQKHSYVEAERIKGRAAEIEITIK